jgi:hypothetical protein
MMRRLVALATVACLATGACDGSDDTSGATTTSSPARPSSTTTTADGVSVTTVPATDPPDLVSDDEILAGVAAGSVEGAALLPAERWTAGVRRGCADLGGVPEDEIDDFFELLRIQVEDGGASRERSRTAIEAFIGGLRAACPELGERLAPLVPAA